MTQNELIWLHTIPDYVHLSERLMNESSVLVDMLVETGSTPSTSGQREQLNSQCATVREVRRELAELRQRLINRTPNTG